MPKVEDATTIARLRRCYPVMVQLRPHLDEEAFLVQCRTQAKEGYRVTYVLERGRVVAVAGWRIQHMLHTGRFLYVDDLVTDEATRSKGHGRALLDWLVKKAKATGCQALELDSGVQRVGAHRFYLTQGMHISSYHFRMPLRHARPRVLAFGARGQGQPS